MSTKRYRIEVRRYTAGSDDDTEHFCDSILAAFEYLQGQRQFGCFRAWVNGIEAKNVYHGVTFDAFLASLDPKAAAVADKFIKTYQASLARIPTNPATYADIREAL